MVLMFEWVLKFRIWVLTVIIGTYVYGILVIDGWVLMLPSLRYVNMQLTRPDLAGGAYCTARIGPM